MPIYDYICTACGRHTEILHGINDPGPATCPACGAQGTMRKRFSAPSVVFKGSGWAKKDRGGSGAARTSSRSEPGASEAPTSGSSKDQADGSSPTTPAGGKPSAVPPDPGG